MRIIQEDAKLGVTKVIWRFAQEPEASPVEDAPPSQAQNAVPAADPLEELTEGTDPAAAPEPEPQTVPEPDPAGPAEPALSDGGHLEDLRQQIRFLQQVVEAQNQQLRTKDELIRNFQVLLKSEQDQVLRLEAARGAVPGETPEPPVRPEGRRLFGWLFRKPGR